MYNIYITCSPLQLPVYLSFSKFVLKIDKQEEDEPSTSANPVLELELTEEKLPMTLSRQEVSLCIISTSLAFHIIC